jgi:PPOX class probable F420-dependent enzyme
MAATFAQVHPEFSGADYLLLTTFTKDGRPKPTPVWAAPDGDRLLVITQAGSWKVRRIRNTSHVTLAVCDLRGRPKTHAVDAVATILDKSENAAVYDAIGRRYGLIGKGFTLVSKLRGGMSNNVGLALRAAS